MIDPAFIREHSDVALNNLSQRGYALDLDKFFMLDDAKRSLQASLEELQANRNLLSKEFGNLKKSNASTSSLEKSISDIKSELQLKESEYKEAQKTLEDFTSGEHSITTRE